MSTPTRPAARYARLEHMIATDRCVLLDGAIGTELIKAGGARPEVAEHVWGLTALIDSPDTVAAVHRRYVDVGCDMICTNTWGLPTALRDGGLAVTDSVEPLHWMDIARRAVRLARGAAAQAGREQEIAIAFSLNGDVDTPDGRETIRLLARAFEAEPPDLILLETLSLVRDSTYATVEALLETGIPVWLSFRRCRQGVCGVPEERYDVIVASLYQTPVDPFEQATSHRSLDYWGRNLLDHLIQMLPEVLADDGRAYMMQLSIIGERRTAELLDRHGYVARVVDFSFFEFTDLFKARGEQIARVEKRSDAYHLRFGESEMMVAYLLEITRQRKEDTRP